MIRHLVRTVMRIPDSRAVFKRSQKGKPFLSNSEVCPVARLRGMQFNVSHHGDWVILAAESRFAVGCDVMRVERPRGSPLAEFFRYMKTNFSESEWASVLSRPKGRPRLVRFMRLWTLKESFVKTHGQGLSFEPKRISFAVEKALDAPCDQVREDETASSAPRARLSDFLASAQEAKATKTHPGETGEKDSRGQREIESPVGQCTAISVKVDGKVPLLAGALEVRNPCRAFFIAFFFGFRMM